MNDEHTSAAGPPAQAMLLTCEEAAGLLSVSRAMFWRLHSQGKVPMPIRLSARVVRWNRKELVDWLNSGCPIREKWNVRKMVFRT